MSAGRFRARGSHHPNRLTLGPNSASLVYDPLGRLVQTSATGIATTELGYAGDQLVVELDTSGNVLRRLPGPDGGDDPVVWYEGSGTASRRWLLADQRGTVVAVSDATGTVVNGAPNTYDEYGVPASANQGRFQYTGQQWVREVGLYHYKARAYSPTLGRFMQTDPIGYASDINLYAYVGNDPINGIDPSGLKCVNDVDDNGCTFDEDLVVTASKPSPPPQFSRPGGDAGGTSGGAPDIPPAHPSQPPQGKTPLLPLHQNLPPCSLAQKADLITDGLNTIAGGSELAAAATSETGFGALIFGGLAAGAKAGALISTGVSVFSNLSSGNTAGAIQSIGNYFTGSLLSTNIATANQAAGMTPEAAKAAAGVQSDVSTRNLSGPTCHL